MGGKIFAFNRTKQNKLSSPRTCILFLQSNMFSSSDSDNGGVVFLCQAQNMLTICLYLRILNFVMLHNYGSSLYTKMKFPFIMTSMMQSSLDESYRELIVWERWSVFRERNSIFEFL